MDYDKFKKEYEKYMDWETPNDILSFSKYKKSDSSTPSTTSEPKLNQTQAQIKQVCDSIGELLLEKNEKYGDSALNPKRVFSKADAVEQIKVRIDDKLSRITTTGFSAVDEDTLQDLIGYLVLLKIALNNQ